MSPGAEEMLDTPSPPKNRRLGGPGACFTYQFMAQTRAMI